MGDLSIIQGRGQLFVRTSTRRKVHRCRGLLASGEPAAFLGTVDGEKAPDFKKDAGVGGHWVAVGEGFGFRGVRLAYAGHDGNSQHIAS